MVKSPKSYKDLLHVGSVMVGMEKNDNHNRPATFGFLFGSVLSVNSVMVWLIRFFAHP
ncbi:hypothetical protein Hanom_Chr02g00169541 [Helianthus anomalus]